MNYKQQLKNGRINNQNHACPAAETVKKLFQIAEGFISQAESLVGNVVEIDGKLADALEAEVLLVTGNKAKITPKILTPSLMFRDNDEGEGESEDNLRSTNNLGNLRNQSTPMYEPNKLFPQIPSSRLSLDFCGILYNSLLVLKRANGFRKEPAKLKSNALYLTGLRSVLRDLSRLQAQRDALDHVLYQSQDTLNLLSLDPQIIAEQLSLLDSSLFSHMHVVEELSFASWIGKERRQRAPYLTAMREFGGYVSHWVTWEILKPGLDMQQRAELVVHFVGIGECLAELGSYNQLSALVRGLCSPAILRLGPLFDVLPKRTLMSWDTLQGLIREPIKQRALLSKAPATCIPAIDTAYLVDLLAIEPELLSLKSSSEAAKNKFTKYCESLEKFRLQSSRVYGLKHALHPAIQHFLLSRPFFSTNELRVLSESILSPNDPNLLAPEACLIKTLHRRYLDDDDRLFFPLRPTKDTEEEEIEIAPAAQEEESFSLGEQPESLQIDSFYPMDDVDERAARYNSAQYAV